MNRSRFFWNRSFRKVIQWFEFWKLQKSSKVSIYKKSGPGIAAAFEPSLAKAAADTAAAAVTSAAVELNGRCRRGARRPRTVSPLPNIKKTPPNVRSVFRRCPLPGHHGSVLNNSTASIHREQLSVSKLLGIRFANRIPWLPQGAIWCQSYVRSAAGAGSGSKSGGRGRCRRGARRPRAHRQTWMFSPNRIEPKWDTIHTYRHTDPPTYIHTYIHACMHACMHTYKHTYTHPCVHTYMHTYIHACMHSYIDTYIHTLMHTHIHNICIYTYIYTCINTYIHRCIHTYVQTYINT